jgi:hypothetical protein
MDAIINKGYKRVLVIMGRRAGKDVVAFNITLIMALKRVGVYFYLLPTYSQGRKVIFDSITSDGIRFLDYIPKELIAKINSQEQKITLVNDSVIQICGTDNIDTLVGTNPVGCVFSEYALQDKRAYEFLRPALLVNGGWALFVSTPRGKNHLWDLYNIALNNPEEWFVYKKGVDETHHVSLDEIAKEEAEGLMSHDLIQQEYFVNFQIGAQGAYYAKYIDRLKLNSQITFVPWDPSLPVNTALDIGVRDSTSIIFFQYKNSFVNIIDVYENSKEGLEHYIALIKSKPYQYKYHIAPHDMRVREFTTGMARIDKARQLGIEFIIAENISIMDGIEAVRTTLPRCYIDQVKCGKLIRALENYRQEWDERREVYKPMPVHDQYSHFADAMRYLCISLNTISDGSSAADLDRRFAQATGQGQSFGGFFG